MLSHPYIIIAAPLSTPRFFCAYNGCEKSILCLTREYDFGYLIASVWILHIPVLWLAVSPFTSLSTLPLIFQLGVAMAFQSRQYYLYCQQLLMDILTMKYNCETIKTSFCQ